jgi:monothiol glutaredoxin
MTFDPASEGLDDEEVFDRVNTAIADNEVVLFMKGTPMMPQCGYSKRALGLVSKYRDDVATVDVLQNIDTFREALEEYSGWTTTPQTFVDGEFVGGSDILAELEERGDLVETLNADPVEADGGSAGDAGVDAPF